MRADEFGGGSFVARYHAGFARRAVRDWDDAYVTGLELEVDGARTVELDDSLCTSSHLISSVVPLATMNDVEMNRYPAGHVDQHHASSRKLDLTSPITPYNGERLHLHTVHVCARTRSAVPHSSGRDFTVLSFTIQCTLISEGRASRAEESRTIPRRRTSWEGSRRVGRACSATRPGGRAA